MRHQTKWQNQEPILRSKLTQLNSNQLSQNLSDPVEEVVQLDKFSAHTYGQDGKVTAVLFHNGNFKAQQCFDQMKLEYPNVNFIKVNTLHAEDIKN